MDDGELPSSRNTDGAWRSRRFTFPVLATRLVASGGLAFAVPFLLSQWNGWLVGGIVGVLGLVTIAVAALLDRHRKVRPGSQNTRSISAETIGAAGLGLGFLAAATIAASAIVPAVDGTVSGTTSLKGQSVIIHVSEGARPGDLLGDEEDIRCRPGMHVVKPAWSTAYACGGRRSPGPSIPFHLFFAFAFAGCWALLFLLSGRAFARWFPAAARPVPPPNSPPPR